MKQLDDLAKSGESQSGKTADQKGFPLTAGPDDDPTLAADVFPHEVPAAARKLASRAERLSRKQQHEAAIEQFQQALQIDPRFYAAGNNLALEYFSAGKPDLAIETLTRLTKSDPQYVLAFDNLAIVLCKLGRYSEAEVAARHAYAAHPFSYKAAYVFGSSMVHQGKWTPEARQALRYASERHPEANELLAKWPNQTAAKTN